MSLASISNGDEQLSSCMSTRDLHGVKTRYIRLTSNIGLDARLELLRGAKYQGRLDLPHLTHLGMHPLVIRQYV